MQLKLPAIGLHSDFVIGQTPNALKKKRRPLILGNVRARRVPVSSFGAHGYALPKRKRRLSH